MKVDLYIGSTNLVKVTGLQDTASGGTYENAATVTCTLYAADGSTEITGQTWPATLNYIGSSNGNYEGVLEDDLAVTEGTDYVLAVSANAGTNKVKTWRIECQAKYADR